MKAIQNFLQSLQLYWFSTLKRNREKIRSVNIAEAVRSAQSILCVLPADPALKTAARRVVDEFAGRHPALRVKLIGSASGAADRTVLTFSENDLTFYGKPKRRFLEQLAASKFDLAVDLSILYDFTNLAVIWHVDAGLRAGFYDSTREDFYNFLFRKNANTLPDQAYRELFHYLEALM